MKNTIYRILLIYSILLTNISWANTLSTTDNNLNFSASPYSKETGGDNSKYFSSKIKICTEFLGTQDCTTYPQGLTAFKGSIQDWAYFFNRCNNFDHINNFNDVAVGLVGFAVLPSLGLVKTIGAELALNFIGNPAYPSDVNSFAVMKSAEIVMGLLKKDFEHTEGPVEAKDIIGLEDILKICSIRLTKDYIDKKSSDCIRGCHNSQKNIYDSVKNKGQLKENIHFLKEKFKNLLKK